MSSIAKTDSKDDQDRPAAPTEKVTNATDGDSQPPRSKVKLALLLVALALAVLCQALDNTIITTAIPKVTCPGVAVGMMTLSLTAIERSRMSSTASMTLDGTGQCKRSPFYRRTREEELPALICAPNRSGYLLTTCAFQLSYGKLYNLYPTKWIFLTALGLFELGSLVCGAAPTSVALIMGRVVQGIGAGGIFSGAILIIAAATPLEKRPNFNGLLGSMFAIASVAGPLMGGAFTDRVTWRLCFYINLPFGLVTAIFVVFFLSSKDGRKPGFDLPLKEKVKQLDTIGLVVFIPCIVSFLLALTWGGATYPWSNWRIILLFVVAGVLLIAFAGVEYWQGDKATVPLSVIKQRTVWASALYAFFLFGGFLAFNYYLPIWFQGVKGTDAVTSGIHILPSILSVVVLSIVSGGLVTVVGYYTWACVLSTVLAAMVSLNAEHPQNRGRSS